MTAKHPTQAAIAEALQISPGRVTHLKGLGMPVYSIPAAAAWKAQNIAPVANTKTAPKTSEPGVQPLQESTRPNYLTSRAKREAAEAEMAEIKLAELSASLIRTEAVTKVWAESITNCRDAMLQIPARLAPQLAAEADLVRCTILLEEALNQALEALSSGYLVAAQ